MTLLVFMRPHIIALSQRYDLTLVANGSPDSAGLDSLLDERVSFRRAKIARDVSILADLAALLALWKILRRERVHVVHSISPKAGLLAMMAGLLAGVPTRIHWYTGQVWATKKGLWRWILKSLDQVLAACATHLLVDSHSQRLFLVHEGVVRPERVTVLGNGSVCGVDPSRFKPDATRRVEIRNKLRIPDTAVLALYLGRLNPDKGVLELASAFVSAARQCTDLHLLLAGPDEAGMQARIEHACSAVADRVHFLGYTAEPEALMAGADFFVLPSHREGFGASVIEAAACGIPAIGTRIYGLTDAIADGETGLLVPVGDIDAIADAMTTLATDRKLRLALGDQALARVRKDFRQETLTDALLSYYSSCTGSKAEAQ